MAATTPAAGGSDVSANQPEDKPLPPLHTWLQPTPTIASILKQVAAHYSLSERDLLSERRNRALLEARHVLYYLTHQLTNHSYATIGRILHRDHSTIIYGSERTKARMAMDQDMAVEIQQLISSVVV